MRHGCVALRGQPRAQPCPAQPQSQVGAGRRCRGCGGRGWASLQWAAPLDLGSPGSPCPASPMAVPTGQETGAGYKGHEFISSCSLVQNPTAPSRPPAPRKARRARPPGPPLPPEHGSPSSQLLGCPQSTCHSARPSPGTPAAQDEAPAQGVHVCLSSLGTSTHSHGIRMSRRGAWRRVPHTPGGRKHWVSPRQGWRGLGGWGTQASVGGTLGS